MFTNNLGANSGTSLNSPTASGQQNLGQTPWGATTLLGVSQTGLQGALGAEQSASNNITQLANQYLLPSNNTFNPTSFSAAQPNLVNPTTAAYNSATGAQNTALTNSQGVAANNATTGANTLTGLQSAYNAAMGVFNNAVGANDPSQSAAAQFGNVESTNATNLNPYITSGTQSTGQLNNLLGNSGASSQQTAIQSILNSPAFQSQLGIGANLVNNQQAVMGQLNSGAGAQALQNYGATNGANYVQQQITNLQGQAGLGETASSALGSLNNQSVTAEQAAALNQANSQSGLVMQGAQNAATQANTNSTNALAGQQMSNNQANSLASTYSQSAAAQQAALQGQFSNANTAYTNNYNSQLAQYNAQQAAQQQYVNLMANNSLYSGQANAQYQLASNPQYTTLSTLGGIQF